MRRASPSLPPGTPERAAAPPAVGPDMDRRRINDVAYVSREEALDLLSIKKESFYSYVSRGLIRTAAHPDRRRRLYLKSDLEKLKTRAGEHLETSQVSYELRYGKPVLQSRITEITPTGPSYRGHPVIDLAGDARRFEVVAELLWTGVLHPRDIAWPRLPLPAAVPALADVWRASVPQTSLLNWFALTTLALGAVPAGELPARDHDPRLTGQRLIQAFAGIAGLLAPPGRYTPLRDNESVAQCMTRGLGYEANAECVRLIDAALVLSADNELSPPTFVARITASTGADLYACVASALQAQSGPMQVAGTAEVEATFAALTGGAGRESAAGGSPGLGLPCFRHPLYARDPRTALLLDLVATLKQPRPGTARILDFIARTEQESGQYPNVFAGLVILAMALGLPAGSAALLHTVGRTAGWIAHASEQRLVGAMLRPRAKFMGARGGP